MAVRANRYNDPALGEAFNNIASIFAPPSAGDMANYANASATREKASRLAQLFANPNDPNFDRQNIAVGNYAPTQSYYAVDQNNATQRYGYDSTAASSRANNAADNARALETNLLDNQGRIATASMDPLNPGQVSPGLPENIAGMFGMPAIAGAAGLDKPLSKTEWDAQEAARLQGAGLLTDDHLMDTILGAETPVKTVDETGQVRFSSPGAAVRTGATPYIEPSAGAAKRAVVLVNQATNQTVPGTFDPTSGTYFLRDGTPAPEGFIPYNLGSPTGSNADLGIGKTATNNIEQQLTDISIAQGTAVKLRDLIATAPASQGVVGALRGTAQNLIQTSDELGQQFGGVANEVNEMIRNGTADANLAGSFDPTLPAIDFLSNLLAFQHAKTTTGERLSNEMLRQSRAALGLDGWTANQADSLARLNMAIEQMGSQAETLKRIRAEGVGAAAGAAPPPPQAQSIGGSEEWTRDANGNLVRAQ